MNAPTVVSSDPRPGVTLAAIRTLVPSLVPSEQKVAAEVLNAPDEVAMLSVADLAARTSTSTATVIRACQSLGFKGFQHLRLLLLRDLGAEREQSAPNVTSGRSSDWVPAFADQVLRQLPGSLGTLDFAQFDAAVAAIATARRVLVVGNGGSAPAAQRLALAMLGAGRACEAPADAVSQQLSARLLGAGDVLVAFSDSGENSITLRSVEAAAATSATVVGVTGYARSRLQELSGLLLVAGAAYTTFGSLAIAATIVQLLVAASIAEAVGRLVGDPAAMRAVIDEVATIVDGRLSDAVEPD